jgi:integrase
MAGIQDRNGSFRAIFRHGGRQHSVPLGKVSRQEAEARAGAIDLLLLRLRQGLLAVPEGVTIEAFILADGKPEPPAPAQEPGGPPAKKDTPVRLKAFAAEYLAARSGGSMEANSLATTRMHLGHFERTLGPDFDLRGMKMSDLQRHLNLRREAGDPRRKQNPAPRPISPSTLRLEVSTLRAAWNWAALDGRVEGRFPTKGLQFPKADERPPFMTLDEYKRRVAAGADAADLAECVYLRKGEIPALLAHVGENATAPWLHALVATAAYTGARRSELLRMEVADVDMAAGVILVREKKRSRKQRTTRHVSMPPALAEALKAWLAGHPGGKALFCQAGVVIGSRKRGRTTGHKGDRKRPTTAVGRRAGVRARGEVPPAPVTRDEAHDHLRRTLEGGEWAVLRGYHTLRHSFISCLAADGVDQRIIDDLVGHCSDEQRRRYRHLVPDVKRDAVKRVFG